MIKMNYGFRIKGRAVFLMLCLAVLLVIPPSALSAKDSIFVRGIIEKFVLGSTCAFVLAITKLNLCLARMKNMTQYRAIFVVNCKIENEKVRQERVKPKKNKRGRESSENEAVAAGGEVFKPVCCSLCSTEVGVIDEDEITFSMFFQVNFES
ncbi:uncharacterized protein LOC111308395 [Durio zibethinus]|uniref:Uncharacterized protein LOC111308395 n=1 Tax=Durio zibethinus TaxID=66656 RepID=A0A6P6AC46_DURZI|nr:uncharacterized protein LOC111308395 [Durio zibethinus]